MKQFTKMRRTERQIKRSLSPAQTIILGFVIVIFIGTFLLSLPISSKSRQWTNFVDSFFMASSAVCVTGLTSLSVLNHYSGFGQAMILLLTQIGGLGIMSAATFIMLIMRKKITLKSRLAIADALNHDTAKGIVRLVRAILIFTFTMEGIGALLLMPVFCRDNGIIGVWQAIFISVSAFCNAGFDILPSVGILNYRTNPLVLLTVAVLILLGGIGFAVISDTFKSKMRFLRFSLHTKIVLTVTAILIAIGTFSFLIAEYSNNLTIGNVGFFNKLLISFFESISIRTAGFNAINHTALTPVSKAISNILMFIGASPGSTGGGIKTTTFALLILVLISVSKGNEKVSVFRHTINHKSVYKALTVFLMSIIATAFLTIFILAVEKNNSMLNQLNLYSFSNIFYDSIATFSTTGITSGLTPHLSIASKLATVLVMFFGRVGLLNFGFALFIDKDASLISYPESNIVIG